MTLNLPQSPSALGKTTDSSAIHAIFNRRFVQACNSRDSESNALPGHGVQAVHAPKRQRANSGKCPKGWLFDSWRTFIRASGMHLTSKLQREIDEVGLKLCIRAKTSFSKTNIPNKEARQEWKKAPSRFCFAGTTLPASWNPKNDRLLPNAYEIKWYSRLIDERPWASGQVLDRISQHLPWFARYNML